MSHSPLSRRGLLQVGATTMAGGVIGAGVSGCDAESSAPDPPAQTPTEPLTSVLVGQQTLLATYEFTLSAFPELSAELSDHESQSIAHTRALMDAAPAAAAQAAASATPSPTSGSTAGSTAGSSDRPPDQPSPSRVPPTDAATARAALAGEVETAARSLRSAALRAEGDLAALLGSCAASTACHARLLA